MGTIVHLNADGTKRCSVCEEQKSAGEFHARQETKTGLASACIDCARKRDRARGSAPNRKETRKWAMMKFQHGITKKQWQAVLHTQNFCCAICESVFVAGRRSALNACVDHDHATGRLRGLLCRRCNQGIGLLQDSGGVAEKAAAYLKRHGK